MTPPNEELTLELERILPADRLRVFGAFTDANQLAQWWGPVGFTIPAVEFDPRVGGSYRIEMKPPEGDPFALIGEFRVVEPPEDCGHSTRVTLRQGPFRTDARQELHREGWRETLDKLAAWLRGYRPSQHVAAGGDRVSARARGEQRPGLVQGQPRTVRPRPRRAGP